MRATRRDPNRRVTLKHVAEKVGVSIGTASVVCANDESAISALSETRAQGLSVPDDISIVGFDDAPIASYTNPPLTTIAHPISQISQVATRHLFDHLNHGTPVPNRVFPRSLIIRGSTAPPRTGSQRNNQI